MSHPPESDATTTEIRTQLLERIRREVAASWTGPESATDDLDAERRAEAAAEECEP